MMMKIIDNIQKRNSIHKEIKIEKVLKNLMMRKAKMSKKERIIKMRMSQISQSLLLQNNKRAMNTKNKLKKQKTDDQVETVKLLKYLAQFN